MFSVINHHCDLLEWVQTTQEIDCMLHHLFRITHGRIHSQVHHNIMQVNYNLIYFIIIIIFTAGTIQYSATLPQDTIQYSATPPPGTIHYTATLSPGTIQYSTTLPTGTGTPHSPAVPGYPGPGQ